MEKKTGFTVSRVEWEYTTSRALTGSGDPNPRPPQRSGIGALHVRCDACGHEWRAPKSNRPTPGSFVNYIGDVNLICPNCEQQGKVLKSELPGI